MADDALTVAKEITLAYCAKARLNSRARDDRRPSWQALQRCIEASSGCRQRSYFLESTFCFTSRFPPIEECLSIRRRCRSSILARPTRSSGLLNHRYLG